MANRNTAAALLTSIVAAATDALLGESSSADLGDLSVSNVGDRIAVSGEGMRRAGMLGSVFSALSRARGVTVTTGADSWEEWEDGVYTCVWIELTA